MDMKWFTTSRLWGPDDSPPGPPYAAHLESIRHVLTPEVAELAFTLPLHDARVEAWREDDCSLTLTFVVLGAERAFERVALTYTGAKLVEPQGTLAPLELLSGDVELLYDEVDVSGQGRFVHRVLTWPTGGYVVEFDAVSLRREQADEAVYMQLAARAESTAANRPLRDAWLDFEPALVRAAALGLTGDVRKRLQDGESPDTANRGGWSALHAAALSSHVETCLVLLDAGAAVDCVDAKGETPLLGSLGRAGVEVLQLLVNCGADVFGGKGDDGASALRRAVSWGSVEAAAVILDGGADVDAVDEYGFTALMTAAETSTDSHMVSYLLSRGADPFLTGVARQAGVRDGERPLEIAARLKHAAAAKALRDEMLRRRTGFDQL